MSKLSVDRFVELLERSKLVDPLQIEELTARWKSSATAAQLEDAEACAEFLVTAGALTHWQAMKLLDGRHRGFFLGKYKLLDHLGSGGMSSVYLAEHVLMQRRVAVKVLPQNRVSDASYLARFHFEARAAAVLDHPNIVRVFDLDNDGRIHYLVMEYIEGYDLDELVSEHGPLDYHTAVEFIKQAGAGLEHAHQAGLVHRDIKPANLLVDMRGTLKILDMGLAKFTSGARAVQDFGHDEHVLGTADYLAPEQAVNSQTVDHRGDIYGLGCTLYFLLTGHPPFAKGTSQERMAAHQHEEPPSLLVERPDCASSAGGDLRADDGEIAARPLSIGQRGAPVARGVAGERSRLRPGGAARLVGSRPHEAGNVRPESSGLGSRPGARLGLGFAGPRRFGGRLAPCFLAAGGH